MNIKLPLSLLLMAAASLTSHAQLLFSVGLDDNDWPVGNGGGPNTSFLQENGVINPLPGSPVSVEVPQGADNDYYFAGVYTTVIPGNGLYTPLGVVPVNEEGAERGFAAADNDLRYHFNLPGLLSPSDSLSVTFDALSLDTQVINPDARYGVEVFFNGVLVLPLIIIRPAQIDLDFTSPLFSLASVNAQTGPGADNILSLRGTNFNNQGGGNWMGVDYVQLQTQPGGNQVPEGGATLWLLSGALGCVFAGRRWVARRKRTGSQLM